jgi:phosphate starvation-inducible PhoH-like protein
MQSTKTKKRIKKTKETEFFEQHYNEIQPYIPALKPYTQAQREYINAIKTNQIIFSTGPAGTGKTYVAASLALEALVSDKQTRIILVRPMVEAEERVGFLPGTLEEKYTPYLGPFLDVFESKVGSANVKRYIDTGRILLQPLAFMRGKTYDNAWVLFDEAQNATARQMKLLLTRIGNNSKFIIDGDIDQVDIRGNNGLQDAVQRLSTIKDIAFVEFYEEDIVRNDIIKDILKAYRS